MSALPLPCPDAETCYAFLVRHGATANNLANPPRIQGCRSNPELSAEGRHEAAATGHFLSRYRLAEVYSSPLLRARQTAEAIAEQSAIARGPAVVEGLTEGDVGRWEGLSWAEIEAQDPEAFALFHQDSAVYPYAGGENLAQVRDRAAGAIEPLLARHRGQAIAIVTHNIVIRSYLTTLLPVAVAKARSIPQHNCGVNVLVHRGGKTSALVVNGVFHLPRW